MNDCLLFTRKQRGENEFEALTNSVSKWPVTTAALPGAMMRAEVDPSPILLGNVVMLGQTGRALSNAGNWTMMSISDAD